MKILTPRNNKDYYDYLSGIYGVDEKVVFDRRNFTILSRLTSPLFFYERTEKDSPKREVPSWMRKDKKIPEYEGTIYHCLLEVGMRWYLFDVERYLDDKCEVCIDWKIDRIIDISKTQRVGTSPISFFNSYRSYGRWYYRRYKFHENEIPKIEADVNDTVSNPILTGTAIPSLIPAEDIYNHISAYISSLNDIEISDTRSDEEKAESAGFDRKTSFRNIK
ncbi:MAG: hypothetical protein HDR83_01545 [Bacteroides sp.]|nr:hypothetical protein [Bacteroides sp.]